MMRRVAVVGAGIAGLGAARALSRHAQVTVYEAGSRFGGHAHTVDLTLAGVTHGVDTGFLVYNDRTYPELIRLLHELDVATAPSDMSFSVQVHAAGLEWSGHSLDTVFAQRSNLLRPRFWGMLRELLRFNRETTAMAQAQTEADLTMAIGDWLDARGFGAAFRDWYLLPMIGCIWSCPTEQMLRFPMATLVRFCHNHGLIRITDRPQWRTVVGGSREYVTRIIRDLPDTRLASPVRRVRRVPPGSGSAGVWVDTDQGSERFDDVVLACHTDQSLAMLPDALEDERAVLSAITYQRNRAVLHTDDSVLPRRRKAWAAWNYVRAPELAREQSQVCLHYLINQLQPLPWSQPIIVSLNPTSPPREGTVHAEMDYDHPVFDLAALAAQQRLPRIQGRHGVWFCGAWTRYGFHEDGLMSGHAVAEALLQRAGATSPAPVARAA